VGDGQVSVLVVDDDAIVRAWVRLSLKGSEFRVAGEAASSREAVDMVERRRPGVLLIDYRLPDGLGTELVRGLRLAGVSAPALLITANPEAGLNELARESGVQGVVRKRGSRDDLLAALRRITGGETVGDADNPPLRSGGPALSPREREVLQLVATGLTNPEISNQLGVGVETVKTLLERAFRKLGVSGRTEATAEAARLRLL
jgi:two-component system, NarL family, nitrate/nitrite response regulator NarL